MPKLNNFNGEDRYNFMLALVGFLQNRGPVSLVEAAEHFELEPKYLHKVVRSINDARAEVSGFERWFFLIDIDELEDNGNLSLVDNLVVKDVPRLSTRQVSAIAAGLNYLATIPAFQNDQELSNLQQILAAGSVRGINPLVELRPGSSKAGGDLIRRAILNGKQISCEYINQKSERAIRTIEPLRIDARADGWYLRGYCPIHEEVRNFKLDRMRSIEVLDEDLSGPARQISEIEDSLYVAEASDTRVLVEVQPEAYRLISDFRSVSEPSETSAGLVRAEIQVGHLPNIGRLIAKYGGAARVIEPAEAREIVMKYALKALGEELEEPLEDQD